MVMTLPQLVTSLELSKRLCELGVKRESYFWWSAWSDHAPAENVDCHELHWQITREDEGSLGTRYSAYTSSELGEMLPAECEFYKSEPGTVAYSKGIWCARYSGDTEFAYRANSLADAMALMLIHLIEQGIIDPKKV